VTVDYVRLAELLTERLRPVLPIGMAVDVATPEYVDHLGARHLGGPRLRHEMGVVVVSSADGPGRRMIQLGPFPPEQPGELDIELIAIALSDIADEASETTTNRYEADAAVEGGDIRVWFGLVPPGPTSAPWRAFVPELPSVPIPMAGAEGA
jgi:hypothetical protein